MTAACQTYPIDIAARFSGRSVFIFDLDKTLYPSNSALWPQIDQRITLFLSEMFGLDGLSALALQKYYFHKFGTTLRGLQHDHKIGQEEFLQFVHDIDRSSLPANPRLAAAIEALKGRKYIFTNGSRMHAQKTIEQLAFAHLFDGIFSVEDAGEESKPSSSAYQRFFSQFEVQPTSAAMFEDTPENLLVPHACGVVTVLVDDLNLIESKPAHADFLCHDLTLFLLQISNGSQEDHP